MRSKEEKLAIVKQVLTESSVRARELEIRHQQVQEWAEKYQTNGEAGLERKKEPGNSLSRLERRSKLTYEEQL